MDWVVEGAEEVLMWLASACEHTDDATRVERIAALERLKGAASAAQARLTTAFADSQRASMPSWTPPRLADRSIGSQVALARHESPTRGDAHLAVAEVLTGSMPHVLAALARGEMSEEGAEAVCRATAEVDPALRRRIDAGLSDEPGRLGPRALGEAARRLASALDADAATRRAHAAVASRRITLRSAADGMAYLTLLAPMAEATGAFRALDAEASSLLGVPCRSGRPGRRSVSWFEPEGPRMHAAADRSATCDGAGDLVAGSTGEARPWQADEQAVRPRGTRAQLMADLAIFLLTGRAIGQPVPVEIQLVMTDVALHGTPVPGARRADRTAHAAAVLALNSAMPHTSTTYASTAEVVAPSTPDAGRTDRRPATQDSPAKIVGSGWLPAGFARDLIGRTLDAGSVVTVRRVIASPDGARVLGLEARRRRVTKVEPSFGLAPPAGVDAPLGNAPCAVGRQPDIPLLTANATTQRMFRGILRKLITVRDQDCRTPFCHAAIRAIDHMVPVRMNGPTSAANGRGVCDRCNLTKEAPGWSVLPGAAAPLAPEPDLPPWQQLMEALVDDGGPPTTAHRDRLEATTVVTPTGHTYTSAAPALTEYRSG